MGEPVEMQELIDECNRLQRQISADQAGMDDCLSDMQTRINMEQAKRDQAMVDLTVMRTQRNQAMISRDQARAERDEAVGMLKEILKYGYISDGHRRAAYDLVVRLGGYQGKTEVQTNET